MKKLTIEQIESLKYFWQQKGDLDSFCDFEKLKSQIQEQFPNLLMAWYNYKASIETLNKEILDL